ncbi:DNA-binding response regulator, OmpR family, contains REC and winged-helix (wHTH) domain [Lishizhenia tianjinensis]|uniref:DNA-binding response regulator, OmpR family, contains REC and winged-helix (WHTH) domain n=2 Tax=Lishizhenia TaxID=559293 RepID=A0A1I6ZXE2_9FLAO|nr:response regulator transcription factor [Lishizhenia tianjinensis]SFT67353.1 DNA-binding response regulator, OmpR family, contains REC and winged-helix (wHTH) domain [Lishizhenia tianjinensis]
MKNLKILLAEDDENLGTLLNTFLKAKGFDVELARNGKLALQKFTEAEFDFLIFDVMMPEMDGFTLAKEIRELDKKTPILFLTAKSMKEDKLEGFKIGADDYLTKPFSMEELLARIEAILRRTAQPQEEEASTYQIGTIAFDPEMRMLHLKEPKKLTTKENQLLKLLAKNKNDVLDRNAALRAIWGDDNYFNGRSMDVYIAKLRKLLKEDPAIEIMNVHGKGFKLIDKA